MKRMREELIEALIRPLSENHDEYTPKDLADTLIEIIESHLKAFLTSDLATSAADYAEAEGRAGEIIAGL
jgi:hypothetical protein